jgi:hypothetical protein
MRWATERLAAAACVLLCGEVAAADPTSSPYGRIEGDVTIVAGAGAVIAPRGPRLEAEVRFRYLDSAGIFAAYEDGTALGSDAEPRRVLIAGLELRPLFLLRWLRGMEETRRARLDLALDSVGIDLGAVLMEPAGATFGSRAGLQLGFGFELPIFADATGLWIGVHGGLRWSSEALANGATANADDRSAFLSLTLAWHQLVMAHLVDLGDEPVR